MKKINYEDLAYELRQMLENLIADELDVNRMHIDVIQVGLLPVAEFTDEEDIDYFEEYHLVIYNTRYWNEKKKNFDFGEPEIMYWVHTEDSDGSSDVVIDEMEYKNRVEDTEE